MRRIAGLEAAFLSFAVEKRRRYRERYCSDEGEKTDKFLLGEIMQSRTNCMSHFARYDAHFSRRYFQALKQLAQLRELQHGAGRREAQDSPPQQSTRRQSQKERYWPAQAPDPPPWDQSGSTKESQFSATPIPTATSSPQVSRDRKGGAGQPRT